MNYWIELEDVSKSYEGVEALKGISFKTKKNGIIGLIGPNGAGKTTLFKILLGLIKCESAVCKVLNRDVWREKKLIKPHIGVLLERPSYPTNITVKEYFKYVFGLYNRVLNNSELKTWAKDYNLPLPQKLSNLSAGMLRKVGLLVALKCDPKVVFLDEPMINIDPIGRKEFFDLIIESYKESNINFLISSHQLMDIEKIADQVIVLLNGEIVVSGKTSKILSNYGEEDKYICVSTNNELFMSMLRKQEWVQSANLEVNQIMVTTNEIDHYEVFDNIIKLARKNAINLLSIQRESSLTHILRR